MKLTISLSDNHNQFYNTPLHTIKNKPQTQQITVFTYNNYLIIILIQFYNIFLIEYQFLFDCSATAV
jgi:hypothetical protein